MRVENNFYPESVYNKVEVSGRQNTQYTQEMANSLVNDGIRMEISQRGFAMAGEMEPFLDTYETTQTLLRGTPHVGSQEMLRGDFAEVLADNYQNELQRIKDNYSGKEQEKQLAILDKAYEEASASVSRGYVKQLRMLTGDIVIKPQTGVSYASEAEAEYAYQENLKKDAERPAVIDSGLAENIHRENSFVPPKKGDGERAASLQISEEAQKRFEESIVHFDRRIVLPEYCGIYGTDKTIATAVESCSKEEQAFVYDIIRQNFLLEDTSSLSEEERQANIALGLKKAQYASETFIPEEYREEFMDAMNTVAKLASAGTADQNGKMDYGVPEAKYLGHGSNLVAATNDIEMMRIMDSAAYKEYQRIGAQSSNKDRPMNQLKYLVNWLEKTAKTKPGMLEAYEAKTDKYMEEKVKNQVLPSHFDNINVSDKKSFLNGLRTFMDKNPNFMSGILARELSNKFWVK